MLRRIIFPALLAALLLITTASAFAAPSISSLTPNSGAVGASVTVAGSGFGTTQGTSTVKFGSKTATATSWSATSIVATVPSGASTGNVVVTVGGVASNGVTFTVLATPSITSLTPASGAIGVSVTIAGSGFGATQGASTVKFNGTLASPASWSPTSISVPVPSGATTGNVVVHASGVDSTGKAFTVAPNISSLLPNSGATGSSVVVSGSNFGGTQGTSTVKFNGTTATPSNWSATSITVPAPGGATTGSVVVTVGGLASNGVTFTVTGPPAISSLTPNSGAVGSSIVIAGSNFGSSQGTVKFNVTAATTITNWTATSITAAVPTDASSGSVVVTAVGNVSSTGVSFTVTPAPNISSLTPNSGAVGSSIVIAGSNFGASQGSGSVTFNGTIATTITAWSASSITATVPAGATTGNVVVTAAGGKFSTGVNFTVTPAPSISSLTPNSGAVGSSIVIAGSNFGSTQGNGSVKFNGTPATVTSWGASSITATAPSGATTGNAVVTAAGGVASAGVNFTVTAAPSIGSLTPNSGVVGSSVTIAGSNFGATQGNGSVTFNGTTASISAWSNTSITATVPAGATTGNVAVTAAGGVASNGVSFTVRVAPGITSLTPASGRPGASITIAGTNFTSTQGTVTFNGQSASISSWSDTSIVAIVPNGASSGNVVITAGGLQSNGATFTVLAPSISSISPASGPSGTLVTISGSNFGASPGTVTFNGSAATISGWSDSSIQASVPSTATTGNVVVSNGGLQSNGITFTVVVPNISSLSPSSAPIGASVTISGSGFGTVTGTVTFAGQAASVSSWSDTSISTVVPNGAVSGNVVVSTAGGTASNNVNFNVIGNAFAGPITYAYDELGRLAGATAATGDAAKYNYDAVGNITSISRYSSSQAALFTFNPKSGPVGTQVTIDGANFSSTAAQDTVTFNGTNAAIVSATATRLAVTVPASASSGSISVTAPAGTVTSTDTFTVTSSSAKPRIDSFTPQIVAQGSPVTISGANFDPAPQNDRLVVNITAAGPPSSPPPTATSMTMTVPASSGSGHIYLSTPNGIAVSAGDLFIPPPGSFYTVSQVEYTGRTTLNAPATTVTLSSTTQTLGLLLFDGVAGHSASVSTAPIAGSSYAFQIYKPDGNPLGPTISCTTPCFLDSQQLPFSGTYALGVNSGSATVTIYDSTAITQSISSGGAAVTFNPVPGQNAKLMFTGTAGQQATVQASSNTIASVAVSILNPDGSILTSRTSSAGSFSLNTVMLPQSGMHTILIDPPTANTGTITLSLVLQGATQPPPARASGYLLDPGNPLYANLAGLFVMNEGSGTSDQNLADAQPASFSGSSAPSWNATDPSVIFGGGASLNSYLNAGPDLIFDGLPPSKMTVAAKVYINGATAGGIAEKYYNGAGFSFMWDSSGTVYFLVYKTGGAAYVATASGAITGGQWIQLAATWDGTVGTPNSAHLYVNGIEQTKSTTSDPGGSIPYANATNQPLYIGSTSFFAPSSINGKMAYLAIYRGRMLSTAELSQLDLQVPLTSDLIGTITENSNPVTKTTTSPGQGVQLTFQAWSGQQVTVQVSNNTIGAVTVNLVKPDGTILASASSSATSFNLPAATLPLNGQYDVVVRPTGATTGSITVALAVQGGLRPQGSLLDTGNPLSTNLAGLFIMNEGSGATDKNLVDAQTASLSGASLPAWNTADPSVVFNGGGSLNSYLNAGTDLAFDQLTPGKVTIVAKVYVNSPMTVGGLAEKNDGNSIDSGFVFGWDANGALRLTVERSIANMRVATGNGTIQGGQWIQVAFTWDGTQANAAAAHLFINGTEQSKASSNDGTGTIGYSNATNQPFRIGNASFDSVAGALNGKMVYLAVYKGRILTPTEMNQLDVQLPIH